MRPDPAPRLPVDRWLLILLIAATFLYSSFSSSLFVSTGALSQADYRLFINQFSIVGTLVSVVAALLVGPLLSQLGYVDDLYGSILEELELRS